jgi:hypothetical protein
VLIAVPSVRSPVVVTFTPPDTASRTTVRLFTGQGAGVYLDAGMLTFHVPRELSASKAANVVVIAKTTKARLNILRMVILPSELS